MPRPKADRIIRDVHALYYPRNEERAGGVYIVASPVNLHIYGDRVRIYKGAQRIGSISLGEAKAAYGIDA